MSKYLKLIIIIIVFNACNNEGDILKKVEYYSESKVIRSERFFNSFEDDSLGNVTIVEYDRVGNKKAKYELKNFLVNGRAFTFYPNGNIKRTSNFKKGIEFGVRKDFTEKGDINNEILSVKGIEILFKDYKEYSNPKLIECKIYPVRNDTAFDYEGRIIYDTNMNVIDSLTFYYDVLKVSSQTSGVIKLNVVFLGTAYNEYKTNINLLLGELNVECFSNGKNMLKDTTRVIKSNKNELEFSYNKSDIENDLLTGLLQLELYSLDGKEKIRDVYFTFYYDLNSEYSLDDM
ncbi:hypothetical protein [Lentimicrobium sp. S6]|uniref:hypothetical protein n=1 Tax=Lentimicrobium sp. S6 TaxID=2735872 RepID=UPI001551EB6F|nr:hypothetical protein [Lentimicrobium sp. S6]NPD44853.1 hypothetical protein [Lentimicrobium sp. S6]